VTTPDPFPYRLHYSGSVLKMSEEAARHIYAAIEKSTQEQAVIRVKIDYLIAGEPLNVFVLGPGIPVMLTGPAFSVPDIVDR
jgi:hypothetical protein